MIFLYRDTFHFLPPGQREYDGDPVRHRQLRHTQTCRHYTDTRTTECVARFTKTANIVPLQRQQRVGDRSHLKDRDTGKSKTIPQSVEVFKNK